MATRGKKISEQPTVNTLSGDEIIPFAKNGTNGAVKVSKLLSNTVAPEEGKGLSTNDFTDEYKTKIEQNDDRIVNLENKHAQFALPGFWRPDGTIGNDTNYSRTGLIPINKNHGITIEATGTKNVAALAMFDAQGVCIWYRKTTDTEATVKSTITINAEDIPSNAVYFSASTYNGSLAESSWSNGDTMEARESAVSDVVQRSKKLLFIDQWKSLSKVYNGTLQGSYDAATDKFKLKWDYSNEHAKKYMPSVTYESAVAMMQNIRGSVLGYDELSVIAPANLPPKGYQFGSGPNFYVQRSEIALYNQYMEVLIFATQANGLFQVFQNPIQLVDLSSLKAVIGIPTTGLSSNPLSFVKGSKAGFPKLEFFRAQIRQSFDVRTSPLLTLDTMQYLVTYAQNTSPITITVHPDVYAKISGPEAVVTTRMLCADNAAVDGDEVELTIQTDNNEAFSAGDTIVIPSAKATHADGSIGAMTLYLLNADRLGGLTAKWIGATLDEEGVAAFDPIPEGAEVVRMGSVRSYLPLNLADGPITVQHSANVALVDNGVEITRQDVDTVFRIAIGRPIPIIKGKKYTLSMDVEGMTESDAYQFLINELAGGATNAAGVINLYNGRPTAVFTAQKDAKVSELTFDDFDRTGLDKDATSKIKITNIRLSAGEYEALPYVAPPSKIEDEQLREQVYWASLLDEAALKNIAFATTE